MKGFIAVVMSAAVAACHAPAGDTGSRVLVETPKPQGPATEPKTASNTTPTSEQREALEALVARDAPLAADVLLKALSGNDKEAAALAAIYIMRLGVKAEPAPVADALLSGIQSADSLTACLSYRWLAALPEVPLPKPRVSRMDPVTAVFATMAYSRRGRIPSVLGASLALDDGTAGEVGDTAAFDRWVERIRLISMAVDDGALAQAIGFHESRRRGLLEVVGNESPRAVAFRYRTELFHLLQVPETEATSRATVFENTHMSEAIAPTLQVPVETVRRLCGESTGSLQREALRTLAVLALSPVAGDLAAARVGMDSTDVGIRVEAARTYLLLCARATVKK